MIKMTADSNVAVWLKDKPGRPAPGLLTDALDTLYAAGPGARATAQAKEKARRALLKYSPGAVYYDVLPRTPVGPVYVATGARGVIAVSFGPTERAFLDRVRKETGALATRAPKENASAIRQMREYLAGKRAAFDLPLDLSQMTEFRRRVLMAALKIPRGQVATYAEIARRIGQPKAARAVGQALGSNPIPIVIPCHRVLASDGSLGGYSGGKGVKTKVRLLKLEGAL
jgi:methylated-DNA-[protein]-cysteine S-methyltransferase